MNSFDELGSRVAPERLADLQAIAAEPSDGAGVSAWEAANAADLVFEYQTAYRGFGIAGAHATARSLDDYVEQLEDGSFALGFEPRCERTAWLLGLVVTLQGFHHPRVDGLRVHARFL